MKCAVYKSEEEWGGGHYFLPVEKHEEIRNILREDGFKIAKKPMGIFEFELSFLLFLRDVKKISLFIGIILGVNKL